MYLNAPHHHSTTKEVEKMMVGQKATFVLLFSNTTRKQQFGG